MREHDSVKYHTVEFDEYKRAFPAESRRPDTRLRGNSTQPSEWRRPRTAAFIEMMSQTRVLLVMAALVLVAAVAPASVTAAPVVEQNETSVEAEFTDPVPAEYANGSVFLWESEPNSLSVTVPPSNKSDLYKVCVQNETGAQIVCENQRSASGDESVTVDFANLSAFRETRNITVVLWPGSPGESEPIGSDTISIRAIEKEGDIDGDGLSNAGEVAHNTSLLLADTDKDSLSDGAEVNNYGTSPTSADTDDDNLSDPTELSRSLSPTDPDTDGDGIPDGVEVELGLAPKDPDADTDGDGLTDAYEYAHGSDPTEVDTDGDGLNDGLEVRLGTDPADSRTTPMLLFAGMTLFGIFAVAARWAWPSWRGRVDRYVPSWVWPGWASADDEAPAEDEGSAEHDADEPAVAPEFDHAERQESSEPVLTDEDRVLQLLRENGGWVYQGLIVEETSWSKSKVSRLLSRMADEGAVEKVSVGRQNVVAEKGSMPDGFGSPFDE